MQGKKELWIHITYPELFYSMNVYTQKTKGIVHGQSLRAGYDTLTVKCWFMCLVISVNLAFH